MGGRHRERVQALALTPDNKIVVVGRAWNGNRYVWIVLRLTSAGQPDPTFNGNGIVLLDFFSRCGTCEVSANAVVVQTDGKIVVAGHVNYDTTILRLTTSGALDPNFGTNGTTITDRGGNDGINALVRACDVHDVPCATNEATARILPRELQLHLQAGPGQGEQ